MRAYVRVCEVVGRWGGVLLAQGGGNDMRWLGRGRLGSLSR